MIEGVESGADDYLVKPVSIPELRARIKIGERLFDYEHRLKNEEENIRISCYKTLTELAEALAKHFRGDEFDFYSAGTETKPQINQDAVRLVKKLYGIDMEKTQYSKLLSDIPAVDVAISMGCNVTCPYIGKDFDDNWQLEDPTGKSDEEFIKVIEEIEDKILNLEFNL